MGEYGIKNGVNKIQRMLVIVFFCHGAIAIFFKDTQIVYWALATLMYVSLFIWVTAYKSSFKLFKTKIIRIIFSIVATIISFYSTLAIELIILGVYIARTS